MVVVVVVEVGPIRDRAMRRTGSAANTFAKVVNGKSSGQSLSSTDFFNPSESADI